jgi:hypothetical protein
MYSILVVGSAEHEAGELEGRLSSVEVLRARDAEDAVEKLGRNRRIDAVLLLQGKASSLETIAAIREDLPAPPPLFLAVPTGASVPEGVQPLKPGRPGELLANLIAQIGR